MKAERWKEIERIYNAALECDAAGRSAFIAEACLSDESLRKEVESLIAHGEQAGSFIDIPAMNRLAQDLGANSPSGQRKSSIHATELDELPAGTVVAGKYRILGVLGRGGMGVVYKAQDTTLRRLVALKFLPPERVQQPEAKERFLLEARAVAALNHPNICTLYEIGDSEMRPFMAMECMEGQTLDHFIAGKNLKLETLLDLSIQIAGALEAAHSKNILHRDIKPSNIFVTTDGQAKIMDFGLAKNVRGTVGASPDKTTTMPDDSLTSPGMAVGTVAYMSPEQARGEELDARSDLFSFGVVLYEIATGASPFSGTTKALVFDAILNRIPASPMRLRPDLPEPFAQIISSALEKDRAVRFQSAAEIRAALKRLRRDTNSDGTAPRKPEASELATVEASRGAGWSKRSILIAGPLIALCVAVAVFAIYSWLASRRAVPFQQMEITRLTDSGKASAAAVSPDGKYVVHAVTDKGKSSLWIRHAATGSNVQIVPPAEGTFAFVDFSRDGNSLYYVFGTPKTPFDLYTTSVLGGNPRKLTTFADLVWPSFSPDEKHIAFVKYMNPTDSALFTANIDRSHERQLAARTFPERIGTTAWSPDGKNIAYALMSWKGLYSLSLAVVPAEGGSERRIGSHKWSDISMLRWLPDGSGLIGLMADVLMMAPAHQIWHISYPEGDARRITNDTNNYTSLSLSGDSASLITVQNETTRSLWVTSVGDAISPDQVAYRLAVPAGHSLQTGLAWTGDGNIVFSALDSRQQLQLWIADAEAKRGPLQLTAEGDANLSPSVCGDGRHLVYLSYRAGITHVLRSNLDGSDARQLTNGAGEFLPSCSPDGTWLTYGDPKAVGVWRMTIDGDNPIRIWEQYGISRISPDGKLVLIVDVNSGTPKAWIIPATGGQPTKTFDWDPELGLPWEWTADGSALLYIKTRDRVSNIWRRTIAGAETKQMTNFTSDQIDMLFSASRDGKRLALIRGSSTTDVVRIRDLSRR